MSAHPLKRINLLKGHPNPALYPASGLASASASVFSNVQSSITDGSYTPVDDPLCYAPDPGLLALRSEIANWLTEFYGPVLPKELGPVNIDRICISGGASQNIACILQVFSDPLYTRYIWLATPTYYQAARMFEDNGFSGKLRAVPEDEQGMDTRYLSAALMECDAKYEQEPYDQSRTCKRRHKDSKFFRHIIYVVPTFSNPSGRSMTRARRGSLVQLAWKHDALVIADDVYEQLLWPASQPNGEISGQTFDDDTSIKQGLLPRLVDLDRFQQLHASQNNSSPQTSDALFGHVISNASFSKIVAPGCRTGYTESSPALALALSLCGITRSGGAASQLVAAMLADLLRTGNLQRHVYCVLQPSYARRWRRMRNAVARVLVPLGCNIASLSELSGGTALPIQPSGGHEGTEYVAGGYFIWISLPRPLQGKAGEVCRRAETDENLMLMPGPATTVPDQDCTSDPALQGLVNKLHSGVRLSFSWETEDHLEEGVVRLGRIISRLLQECAVAQ